MTSGVWSKALEGQRLRAKLLESPVDEFISASVMSTSYDRIDIEKMSVAGIPELPVDSKAHAEVGVENTHRTHKIEQHLTIESRGRQKMAWRNFSQLARLLPTNSRSRCRKSKILSR